MLDAAIQRELSSAEKKCRALIDRGLLTGVRNARGTAIYMAIDELVHQMNPERLAEVVREGIDPTVAESWRRLAEELARNILVSRADK